MSQLSLTGDFAQNSVVSVIRDISPIDLLPDLFRPGTAIRVGSPVLKVVTMSADYLEVRQFTSEKSTRH